MQLKLMTFLKRYKTTVVEVCIGMRLKLIHKGHIIRMQLFSLRPPQRKFAVLSFCYNVKVISGKPVITQFPAGTNHLKSLL